MFAICRVCLNPHNNRSTKERSLPMKHNLRMAFLSLLLVLTLGVMPVFAESADHAMDWTHGIGTATART